MKQYVGYEQQHDQRDKLNVRLQVGALIVYIPEIEHIKQ